MSAIVALFVLALLFSLAVSVMVVAVLALRGRRPRQVLPPPASPRPDAREILRARFAAGEIDEDEYVRKMSALSQDW